MEKSLNSRVLFLYALLILFTLVGAALLLTISRGYPILLGLGALAYLLGLRHAVDPDHIMAIDNTTRKMMSEGKKPIENGLFFSLGHSTIVILMVAAIAFAANAIFNYLYSERSTFALIGTLVSALFLCIIALINLYIMLNAYNEYKKRKPTKDHMPKGLMGTIFSGLFKSIHSSWQLYPIGVLFGLGFDTASEVALLGIAATEAGSIPLLYVLILPVMFAAGMTIVDSTDSVLMVHAYGWTLNDQKRRLRYNIIVTGISVAVAFIVAGAELLGLPL